MSEAELLALESAHGIPGNIKIMALLRNNFDLGVFPILEKLYVKRFPTHKYPHSWLWVLYSDLCGRDLEVTAAYLRSMLEEQEEQKTDN